MRDKAFDVSLDPQSNLMAMTLEGDRRAIPADDEQRLTVGARLYGVRRERQALIPLSDGVELAASLYLPEVDGAFPSLLSFYPYRKDDVIGGAYEYVLTYLAQRGYATLLIDSRGSGSSGGMSVPTFDFHAEAHDGVETLNWVASQPWSNGRIGVWGISYGGAMALAIAAEQPPHLEAICSIYASPNSFRGVVYPGGMPSCLNNSLRETVQLARDLAPPTFQDPEGRWSRVWREHLQRLERGEIASLEWPDHPDQDAYWRRSAVDVSDIDVPAFVVGGWNDALLDGTLRTYEALRGHKRLVVGPWVHCSPDTSPYEPYDYPLEMCRWFDRWLCDQQEGSREHDVRVFLQGAQEWRSLSSWPPCGVTERTLWLAPDKQLVDAPPTPGEDGYEGLATVGARAGGMWNLFGMPIGLPREQTPDDQRSLTYTSKPLEADLAIVGSPRALLHVRIEVGTELYLAVKLSHVAPDGTSTLVATGWLNAAHRNSSERSEPLKPGLLEPIEVTLWPTAYRIPAGHCLRIAIACADFPRAWPTSLSPTIRVAHGAEHASRLLLPTVTAPGGIGEPSEVPRPDPSVNRSPWQVDGEATWRVEEDRLTGAVTTIVGSWGKVRLPTGGTLTERWQGAASVSDDDPAGARVLGQASIAIDMPAGEKVEIDARTRHTRIRVQMQGRVTIDGRTLLDRHWSNDEGDCQWAIPVED